MYGGREPPSQQKKKKEQQTKMKMCKKIYISANKKQFQQKNEKSL